LNTIIDLKTFNGGIYIWADNAFHNYKVLSVAITLQNTITLSFLTLHHGWSICDTHFGHGKRKLRKDVSLDHIQTVSDIVNIFRKLQNTNVEIIGKIPKQLPPRENFKPETGNMSDHYFWKFLGNGQILCKENFTSDVKKTVDF
jgi:protein-arginine kinase activator protein McsA